MPVQLGDMKLYSILELSEILKTSKVTLRTYMKTGKLRGQKVGAKWYATEESLKEFFAGKPRRAEQEGL
ncbi:MAG: helix-turn-helix domain-containing protein [Pseudomonadota bacterium]